MHHAKDFADGFNHVTPGRVAAGLVVLFLAWLAVRLARRRPPDVNLTVVNPGGGGFSKLRVAAVVVGVLAVFAAIGRAHPHGTAKASPVPSPSSVPSPHPAAPIIRNVTTIVHEHSSWVPTGPWLTLIVLILCCAAAWVLYVVGRFILGR